MNRRRACTGRGYFPKPERRDPTRPAAVPRSSRWRKRTTHTKPSATVPERPPLLEVAWRHTGEKGKIHYHVRQPDGSTRPLITRDGDALYEVLEQHLAAIGYTGSAVKEPDEH